MLLHRVRFRSFSLFTACTVGTAVSCPTALGALCGQLTFRLAWCRQHSAVTATELLQPLDLACGTLFQSSCVILTSPTYCSDDSWRDAFFGKHEHGAPWLLLCGAIEKHLLTYGQRLVWNASLYVALPRAALGKISALRDALHFMPMTDGWAAGIMYPVYSLVG